MKHPINTHVRLFDLVRYMRSELHEANLIDDDEYAWLCMSAMATSPEGGSPSPRRLEDYDDLRRKMATLREALEFYAGAPWVGHAGSWAYSNLAAKANEALAACPK